MQSPVWTPTGSMFSMPQMVMACVVGVPHDLEFDLLVALDALLHQNLMDGGERAERCFTISTQLVLVVGKAAAGAAQSKGGAKHHGIADALRPPAWPSSMVVGDLERE